MGIVRVGCAIQMCMARRYGHQAGVALVEGSFGKDLAYMEEAALKVASVSLHKTMYETQRTSSSDFTTPVWRRNLQTAWQALTTAPVDQKSRLPCFKAAQVVVTGTSHLEWIFNAGFSFPHYEHSLHSAFSPTTTLKPARAGKQTLRNLHASTTAVSSHSRLLSLTQHAAPAKAADRVFSRRTKMFCIRTQSCTLGQPSSSAHSPHWLADLLSLLSAGSSHVGFEQGLHSWRHSTRDARGRGGRGETRRGRAKAVGALWSEVLLGVGFLSGLGRRGGSDGL